MFFRFYLPVVEHRQCNVEEFPSKANPSQEEEVVLGDKENDGQGETDRDHLPNPCNEIGDEDKGYHRHHRQTDFWQITFIA